MVFVDLTNHIAYYFQSFVTEVTQQIVQLHKFEFNDLPVKCIIGANYYG